MWHLKTKLGTFWIIESDKEAQKYYLGCEDDKLGEYNSLDKILDDVCNQETGFLKWDEQLKVTAPHDIGEWEEGPPENW
ncbi:MAG TPA: hypothetical protein VFP93_02720 [Gammaproteobacteria bacterium]|nr:hypothetical protein [Gammaproteobacteria bacterium]